MRRPLVLTLVTLAGIAGCSQFNREELSAEEIFDRHAESIAAIAVGDDNRGTGFFIKGKPKHCTLATVGRLVAGADTVTAISHDKQVHPITARRLHPSADLAVVSFPVESDRCPYPALALAKPKTGQPSTPIHIYGYPTATGGTRVIISGTLARNAVDAPVAAGYGIAYKANASLAMKGAPVFDRYGDVLAVHGATDRELLGLLRGKPRAQEAIESRLSALSDPWRWGVPARWSIGQEPVPFEQVATVTTAGDSTYAELIRQGSLLLLANEADSKQQAVALFAEATELQPESTDAYILQGNAYLELARLDDAQEAFEQAIAIDPGAIDAWYSKGNIHEVRQDVAAARQAYQKTLEIDPTFAQSWYRLAGLANATGDVTAALEAYNRYLTLLPTRWEVWYEKARLLWTLGRYPEVIEAYDRVVEHRPDWADAWNDRGAALYQVEQYNEAIASYERALELDAESYRAWSNRGIAQYALGLNAEALDSYEKALAIEASNDDLWHHRALALAALERYEEALENYDKAIALNPQNDRALINRGIALHHLDRDREAIAAYKAVLAVAPNNPLAWYNTGFLHQELGEYEAALVAYDRAVELLPESIDAWFNRGEVQLALGRYRAAVTSYDRVLALQPDHKAAKNSRDVASGRL